MYRGRRLRKNSVIRDMMKETRLSAKELVYPLFVTEQPDVKQVIPAMPGVYHYSLDHLHEILDEMVETGVLSCILFGIPLHKDACGSSAYAQDGIIQKAIAYIKQEYPMLYVIADVCMCEYTDHGHCGILCEDGHVDNDVTLTYLNKIALSYAAAGVDMVTLHLFENVWMHMAIKKLRLWGIVPSMLLRIMDHFAKLHILPQALVIAAAIRWIMPIKKRQCVR